jgi:hypothetical protein
MHARFVLDTYCTVLPSIAVILTYGVAYDPRVAQIYPADPEPAAGKKKGKPVKSKAQAKGKGGAGGKGKKPRKGPLGGPVVVSLNSIQEVIDRVCQGIVCEDN